jgi:beta-lactamase class A
MPLGRRERRRHEQLRNPQNIDHRRQLRWMAFLIFVCLIGFLVLLLSLSPTQEVPVARAKIPAVDPMLAAPEPTPQFVARGLRAELGRVAERYPASYGVVVSDPSSGETVTMNQDQRFLAASLTKLPTLLTLYRGAARGEVDLDAEITMRASDVKAYGTGVLYLRPVGTTMTLRECAELMIKDSDNTAWVMLHRYMGRSNVEAELYDMGARSTQYWNPNTTTPHDILLMLEKVADPSYTSPELSAEMLDMMTNTSFEDRLPQLLPEGTRVAHKIGSYGDTFSDAGIVFPEGSQKAEDAYYIVVIVGDTTEWTARSAIQEMSLAAYESLANALSGPESSSKQSS